MKMRSFKMLFWVVLVIALLTAPVFGATAAADGVELAQGVSAQMNVFYNQKLSLLDLVKFTDASGEVIPGLPENARIGISNPDMLRSVIDNELYVVEGADEEECVITYSFVDSAEKVSITLTRVESQNYAYLSAPSSASRMARYGETYEMIFDLYENLGEGEKAVTSQGGYGFIFSGQSNGAGSVFNADDKKVHLTVSIPSKADMGGRDYINFAFEPSNQSLPDCDMRAYRGVILLADDLGVYPFDSFDVEFPEKSYGIPQSYTDYTLTLYPVKNGERVDVQLNGFTYNVNRTGSKWGEKPDPVCEVMDGELGDYLTLTCVYDGNGYEVESGVSLNACLDGREFTWFYYWPPSLVWNHEIKCVEARMFDCRENDAVLNGEPYFLPHDYPGVDVRGYVTDVPTQGYGNHDNNSTFWFFQTKVGEGEWTEHDFREFPEGIFYFDEDDRLRASELENDTQVRIRAYSYNGFGNFTESVYSEVYTILGKNSTVPALYDDNYRVYSEPGFICINLEWCDAYDGVGMPEDMTAVISNASGISIEFDGYDPDDDCFNFNVDTANTQTVYSFDVTLAGTLGIIPCESTIHVTNEEITKRYDEYAMPLDSSVSAREMFNITDKQIGLVAVVCDDESDEPIMDTCFDADNIGPERAGTANIYLYSILDANDEWYIDRSSKTPLAGPVILNVVDEGYDYVELSGPKDAHTSFDGDVTVEYELYGYANDIPTLIPMEAEKYACSWDDWDMPDEIDRDAAKLYFEEGKLKARFQIGSDPEPENPGTWRQGYYGVHVRRADRQELNPIEFGTVINAFDDADAVPQIAGFVLDETMGDYKVGYYDNNRTYEFYYKPVDSEGNTVKPVDNEGKFVDPIPASFGYFDDEYWVNGEGYNPQDDINEAGIPIIKVDVDNISSVGSADSEYRLKVPFGVYVRDSYESRTRVGFNITCLTEKNEESPRVARFDTDLDVYTPNDDTPKGKSLNAWLDSASSRVDLGLIPAGSRFCVGYDVCPNEDGSGDEIEGYPVDVEFQYLEGGEWITATMDQLTNGVGFPAKMFGTGYAADTNFQATDAIGAKFRAVYTAQLESGEADKIVGVYEIAPAATSVKLKDSDEKSRDLPLAQFGAVTYAEVFDVTPEGAVFMLNEEHIDDCVIGTDRTFGMIKAHGVAKRGYTEFTAYAPGKRAEAVKVKATVNDDRAYAYIDAPVVRFMKYGQSIDLTLPIKWIESFAEGRENYVTIDLREENNSVRLNTIGGLSFDNQGVDEDGNLTLTLIAGPEGGNDGGCIQFIVSDGNKSATIEHNISFLDAVPDFQDFEIDYDMTEMDAMPFEGTPITIYLKPVLSQGVTSCAFENYTFAPKVDYHNSGRADVEPPVVTVENGRIKLVATFFGPDDANGGDTNTGVSIDVGIKDGGEYLFTWDYYPNVICTPKNVAAAEIRLVAANDESANPEAVANANIGDELRLVTVLKDSSGNIIYENNDGDGDPLYPDDLHFSYYIAEYDEGDWRVCNARPSDDCALNFDDEGKHWIIDANNIGSAKVAVRAYANNGDMLTFFSQEVTVAAIPAVYNGCHIYTHDATMYVGLEWSDEYKGKEFSDMTASFGNADGIELEFEGFDYENRCYSLKVLNATKAAYTVDVTMSGYLGGAPCSSTITITTQGISKSYEGTFELPLGMEVNADKMFNIAPDQIELVYGYAEPVDPENDDVIGVWEAECISGNNVGQAKLYLRSRLDGELEDATLAGPVLIEVVNKGYEWYKLEADDPILMSFGAEKVIEFTLYGENDGEEEVIAMTDADYNCELYDCNLPDEAMPTLAIDDDSGKLLVAVPAIDDPDPANSGDRYWGSINVGVKLAGYDDINGIDRGVTLSIFDGDQPAITRFELDTGKGDYKPGSYVNNAEGENYTLYFTAYNGDDRIEDLTDIYADYFFDADFYEIDWDDYYPEDDDEPKIKVLGYEMVEGANGQPDQVKLTFHLNHSRDDGKTFTDIGFWTSCHYGNDADAPLSARFGTYIEVYTPDDTREPAAAEVWLDGNSSQPYAIPLGAQFHVGFSVNDANGERIDGYPVDMRYEYLDDSNNWQRISTSDILSGEGNSPFKAKSADYVNDGSFIATQKGIKFHVCFDVEIGGKTVTECTDTYQVVEAATYVRFKNDAQALEKTLNVPQVSTVLFSDVFESDGVFAVEQMYDSDDIGFDQRGGYIYAYGKTEGASNSFRAYVPNDRVNARELTVTITGDRMWAYVDSYFPGILAYGQQVSGLETVIRWMYEFIPEDVDNGTPEEEKFKRLDLNEAGCSVTVAPIKGVKDVAQTVNQETGNPVLSFTAADASDAYDVGCIRFTVNAGGKSESFLMEFKLVDPADKPKFDGFYIDYDLTEMDAMPFDGKDMTVYLRPVAAYGESAPISLDGYSFDAKINPRESGRDDIPNDAGFSAEVMAGAAGESDCIKLTGPYFAPAPEHGDITGVDLYAYRGVGDNRTYLFQWSYYPNVICTPAHVARAEIKFVKPNDESAEVDYAVIGDELKLSAKFFNAGGIEMEGEALDGLEFGYYIAVPDASEPDGWKVFNSYPGDDCALNFDDEGKRWIIDARNNGVAGAAIRLYNDSGELMTFYTREVTVMEPLPLNHDDNYRLEFDGDRLILKCRYDEYGGVSFDDWQVTPSNPVNCAVSDARFDFADDEGWICFSFGFDLEDTTDPKFAFDVTLKASGSDGKPYEGSLTVGTIGIGNKSENEYELLRGSRASVAEMFDITPSRFGLVNCVATVVNGDEEFRVETYNVEEIFAEREGVASLTLYSQLDDTTPLTDPVTLNIIDEGYYDYGLVCDDDNPIAMQYGEAKTVNFRLTAFDDSTQSFIAMADDKYEAFVDEWNMPGVVSMPQLSFDGGNLVCVIPAVADPDSANDGNTDKGYFSISVCRKDILSKYWYETSVGVYETVPELAGFALDVTDAHADNGYKPGYYANGVFTLYFDPVDAQGNIIDEIPNYYTFTEPSYNMNWDYYNPADDGDDPRFKVVSLDYVMNGEKRKQLKLTFGVDFPNDQIADEPVNLETFLWCYAGNQNEGAPRVSSLLVELEVYEKSDMPLIYSAHAWVDVRSSKEFTIPVGAGFFMGGELCDENGERIENYPLDMRYEYLKDGEWVTATPAQILSGSEFPVKAVEHNYQTYGRFIATEQGGTFRIGFAVPINTGTPEAPVTEDRTFYTKPYTVVEGAASVTLKDPETTEMSVPKHSILPYDKVFNVLPVGAGFLIEQADDEANVNVNRESGYINVYGGEGDSNTFKAYAPGKRGEAVNLKVTVSGRDLGMYISSDFPNYMAYGSSVENLEVEFRYSPNDDVYDRFDLNTPNNTVNAYGVKGIEVVRKSVNADGNLVISFTAPEADYGFDRGGIVFAMSDGEVDFALDPEIRLLDASDLPTFKALERDYTFNEMPCPFEGKPYTLKLTPVPVDGQTEPISLDGYSFNPYFAYGDSGHSGSDELDREFTATVHKGVSGKSDWIEVRGTYYGPADAAHENNYTGMYIDVFKGDGDDAVYLFGFDYYPYVYTAKGVARAEIKLVHENDEAQTSVTRAAVGDKLKLIAKFLDASGDEISKDGLYYGYYLSQYDEASENWIDYKGDPGDKCALAFADSRWMLDAQKPGKARVLVRAYGDNGGILTFDREIIVYKDAELNVEVLDESIVYDGSEKTPTLLVTAKDGDDTVTLRKTDDPNDTDDYIVEYVGNRTNVGTVTVNVTGTNEYIGTATTTFEITPKALSDEMVAWKDGEPNYTYNRQERMPAVIVKDIAISDSPLVPEVSYQVEYDGNTNATNDAITRVMGLGNYTGVIEKKFTIAVYSLTDKDAAIIADKPWTGSRIEITADDVTVKDSEGQILTPTSDYTVAANAENTVVGNYAVTVTGKGNYSGTLNTAFNIVKASQSAPEGLSATAPSVKGKDDGTITGVTALMEYRAESSVEYTSVEEDATQINGKAGSYLVRFEGNDNQLAGEDAKIVIPESGVTLSVTFDPNYEGGTVQKLEGLSYKAKVVAPVFVRDGYAFKGWYKDKKYSEVWTDKTEVTEIITLYAEWTAEKTDYSVNHYKEMLNGEYTLYETTFDEGDVGSHTQASENAYEGFRATDIIQKTIAADGSTVVDIYYNRNTHKLTFRNNADTVTDVKFGATVIPPTLETVSGKILLGWVDGTNIVTFPVTMPDADVTYVARWQDEVESEAVTYTVNHMRQGFDADYALFETESVDLKVTDNVEAVLSQATRKNYTGFTFANAALDDTTLTINYSRNAYKLTVNANDKLVIKKDGEQQNAATDYEMPYGKPIALTADWSDGSNNGYAWKGWKSGNEDLLVNSNASEFNFQMPAGDVTVTPEVTTKTFRLIFDANGGLGGTTRTVAFGASIKAPADPTRLGYTFDCWKDGKGTDAATVDLTNAEMPAADTTYFASWTPDTNTPYTVEHYVEDLSGEYMLAESELKEDGTTDVEKTVAGLDKYIKDGNGFTLHEGTVIKRNIAADGSTLFEIYYDRDSHDVTFKTETFTTKRAVKFGATVQAPVITRQGYDITGWEDASGNAATFPITMPDANMSYNAVETPREDTPYSVRHIQQSLNGEYSDAGIAEIESKIGKTGEKATLVPRSYAGFGKGVIQNPDNTAISGAGRTVADVYYARNRHTLTFDYGFDGDNSGANDTKDIKDVMYGAQFDEIDGIPAFDDESNPGYMFDGWYPELPETVPDSDITFTAVWSAGETEYYVEHWLQDVNNPTVYKLDTTRTDTRKGTVDNAVTAAEKRITGFALNTEVAGTQISGTVTVEPKLTLKLYYDRKSYTLSYNLNGGTANEPPASKTVKFDAAILDAHSTQVPTRTGYTFKGWSPSAEVMPNMPARNLALIAIWEANPGATYTVRSHYEDITGGYVDVSKEQSANFEGENTTVNAAIEEITGMVFDDMKSVKSGILARDGSLVLDMYYNRVRGSFVFDANGGVGGSTRQILYGAAVTPPTVIKEGYTFIGWTPEAPKTAGIEGGTYKAQWTGNPATYTVEHYRQNLDGTYSRYEIEIKDAKVGDEIDLSENIDGAKKTYTGFAYKTDAALQALSGTVSADNKLTLKLYYDRETYTLTFCVSEPESDTPEPEEESRLLYTNTETVMYGASITKQVGVMTKAVGSGTGTGGVTVPAPISDTCYLAGWEVSGGENTTNTVPTTMPAGNRTLTTVWVDKKTSVAYTTEYYVPNGTDGYTKTSETAYGEKETTVYAETPDKSPMYELDEDHAGYKASGVIPESGPALVLKVYYKTMSYSVNLVCDETILAVTPASGAEHDSGENVTVKAEFITGADKKYEWAGWISAYTTLDGSADMEYAFTMPADDVKLTANVTPKRYAATFIGNVLGNAPDGYDYSGDDIILPTAVSNDKTKGFAGWKINGSQELYKSIPGGKIPYDFDSKDAYSFEAVFKNYVTLTFDADGGKFADGSATKIMTDLAGAAVTKPDDPTWEGKTFAGWSKDVPAAYPEGSITYTAQWKNNNVMLTFNANGGKFADGKDVKEYNGAEGMPVPTIEIPTHDNTNMMFAGWQPAAPANYPANDTAFTAQWTENGGGGDDPGPGPDPGPEPETATLRLSASSKTMFKDATVDLSYTITPAEYVPTSVKWESSDEAVATVRAEGSSATVTAVGKGSAVITVTVDDMSASCRITVANLTDLSVSGLTDGELRLKEKEQRELTLGNVPQGMNPKFGLVIDDETIATGSVSGLTIKIAGVKEGETDAKIVYLGLQGAPEQTPETLAAFKIKVSKSDEPDPPTPPATERAVRLEEMYVGKGMKVKLTNLLPYGYKGAVTWTSADAAVAKINAKGVLIAVKPGETTLTATFSDSSKETVKLEIVDKKKAVQKLSAPKKLNMLPLATQTVTPKIKPIAAEKKGLKWFTSDERIATVSENGTITAKKPGTAYITAIATSGVICDVRVTVKQYAISDWSISDTAITLKVGETKTLTSTVLPAEANQKVTWKSSKPKIAKVDKTTGMVTAIKPGKATITCVFANGKKLKCVVTVTE